MHPKEFKRQKTGTGRMTRVCLENSEIVMGEDFTLDNRVNALIVDPLHYPVILYPGPQAVDLTSDSGFLIPNGKNLLVFIIDGTWSKAKKMMRLSRNLHSLPRVSFLPPGPSRFAIKQQPHPLCLSTIEAVHLLLECLDRRGYEHLEGRHANLLEVIDGIVKFQKECAVSEDLRHYGPIRGYKDPSERSYPKKWTRRSFFFKG
jgi:DTW domain-containing protein YfiP